MTATDTPPVHLTVRPATAGRLPRAEGVGDWHDRWGKPVVDECSYEGGLEYGWGNISGAELVRRCWDSAVCGGHGETCRRPGTGPDGPRAASSPAEAPARIAFLRRMLEGPLAFLSLCPTLTRPRGGIPGTRRGVVAIDLPAREYMALRVTTSP
jgi:hypothetical protein